jgi:hypothetical protein
MAQSVAKYAIRIVQDSGYSKAVLMLQKSRRVLAHWTGYLPDRAVGRSLIEQAPCTAGLPRMAQVEVRKMPIY